MKSYARIATTVSVALTSLLTHADSIPPLNLDIEKVTVSGLSSGGYMATQFHLAHSDWVKGNAVIGTGPYFCAQGDIGTALNQCVSKLEAPIPIDALNAKANEYAQQGLIAPLDNLQDSKVWILSGTLDTTVIQGVSDALFSQYQGWTATENINYLNDKRFSHHFPTESNGGNCMSSESPFIGNCDYDAAGELLKHLKGDLNPKSEQTSGKLIRFEQQELGGNEADSLGDTGYVYVPQQCEQESCELHISFHGCNQYQGAVGDAYATQTGLNQWADSNNLVVLYPQAKKSLFMPLNPQGCWDWWGYTGAEYATKNGRQITAVRNMVTALSQSVEEE